MFRPLELKSGRDLLRQFPHCMHKRYLERPSQYLAGMTAIRNQVPRLERIARDLAEAKIAMQRERL